MPPMVHTVVKMSKKAKNQLFEALFDAAYVEWTDLRGYNASFNCKPPCSWKVFRKDALENAGWLLIDKKLDKRSEGWLK